MNKSTLTYKKSGVNIDSADRFVNFISNISSKKRGDKKPPLLQTNPRIIVPFVVGLPCGKQSWDAP